MLPPKRLEHSDVDKSMKVLIIEGIRGKGSE